MDLTKVIRIIEADVRADSIYELFNDYDTFMIVDWREFEEDIINYCEMIIKTGSLTTEFEEVTLINELFIIYKDKRVMIPLTHSAHTDRQIALHTLNQVLYPDYEIRFCIDSSGADTIAFVPLSEADWKHLEEKYGEKVAKHFCTFGLTPDLFNGEF